MKVYYYFLRFIFQIKIYGLFFLFFFFLFFIRFIFISLLTFYLIGLLFYLNKILKKLLIIIFNFCYALEKFFKENTKIMSSNMPIIFFFIYKYFF